MSKLRKPNQIKNLLLLLSALFSATLLIYIHNFTLPTPPPPTPTPPPISLAPHNLLFSIASSSFSLPSRAPYIRLWHAPISHFNKTFLFLDQLPNNLNSLFYPPLNNNIKSPNYPFLPHIITNNENENKNENENAKLVVSSGHRIAKIVKQAVNLNVSGVSWFVFGDDDTVFVTENLVRILGKYDHEKWWYVGSGSESYEQNEKFSFSMAFGGGGFAISSGLGKVLGRVMGSCLRRYGFLYGSDARVFACLAELGVKLTVEPGFHQVDIRGDLFGMLAAHPLAPVASLHHIDAVEPIFPGMNRINALQHLFKAVHVDPGRILQQTVCYDRTNLLTVSISWGYVVQVYEGNVLLPELLALQRTFRPWKRGKNVSTSRFMFNTRDFPKDRCKRPLVFFLNGNIVEESDGGAWTHYTRHIIARNCSRGNAVQKLRMIGVFARSSDNDSEQLKTPRRDCCDVSSSFDEKMIVRIRKCGIDELIAMDG